MWIVLLVYMPNKAVIPVSGNYPTWQVALKRGLDLCT